MSSAPSTLQETRSAPLRSPLSLRAFGTRGLAPALGVFCLVVLVACGRHSPTEPQDTSLTGQWTVNLTRAPCAGDWSSVVLTLQQAGNVLSGDLATRDGMDFAVSGTLSSDRGEIDIPLPVGVGECSEISFLIDGVTRGSSGRATAFSGQARGACCGTILEPYQFTRLSGA
jgi:hypothetical protein